MDPYDASPPRHFPHFPHHSHHHSPPHQQCPPDDDLPHHQYPDQQQHPPSYRPHQPAPPPPYQQPPFPPPHSSHHPPGHSFPHDPYADSPSYEPPPYEPPFSESHSHHPPGHSSSHGYADAPSHESAHKHACSSDIQLPRGQLVKIFPKSDRGFSLAVRNNAVVMVLGDTNDDAQLWIKDGSYGLRVKDNTNSPAFALVNRAHGKILKHAKEKGQQVLLEDYRLGMIGDDILWTESQDFGEGYTTIRAASDTLLNLTIFQGEKKISGVRNGSPVIMDTWHKHDSQLWKIFPL